MMIDCSDSSEMNNSQDINEMGVMSDFMDNDFMLDDVEENLASSPDDKIDVRRRLEKYLEDVRLRRELDY